MIADDILEENYCYLLQMIDYLVLSLLIYSSECNFCASKLTSSKFIARENVHNSKNLVSFWIFTTNGVDLLSIVKNYFFYIESLYFNYYLTFFSWHLIQYQHH